MTIELIIDWPMVNWSLEEIVIKSISIQWKYLLGIYHIRSTMRWQQEMPSENFNRWDFKESLKYLTSRHCPWYVEGLHVQLMSKLSNIILKSRQNVWRDNFLISSSLKFPRKSRDKKLQIPFHSRWIWDCLRRTQGAHNTSLVMEIILVQ